MTKITHQLGAVATAAGTLVAVGLLMLMEMVEAGPAGATFPGKNGRIAYSSYDAPFPKGDLEIYTINARGGDKFQLTHNDVDEEWPTYSPSGKRIAYAPIEGVGGIYSIRLAGGTRD